MKIYIRRKEPGKGWRYRTVPKVGRCPVAEAGAKFHVRYPDADDKFVWSQGYDSFEEAEKAAAGLELNVKAVALGLTIEECRLRKTCAINWELNGVRVRTIQAMLGHKGLETTRRYLGINES